MDMTPSPPRRSREDLLATLLDTATDILALDDVEDVLQAIVRRTRALLGTDMAYISFTDARSNETYIRQTDGVATHGYRTLRQPLGTGVLGQIARGIAPAQTRDYLVDPRLNRIDRIDRIVREEGVRAIMGVPLTVGGRALGALVVAERQPRVFTPEEISDVDLLGRHAAVALDRSMRFAELSRTAADLEAERVERARELALITDMLALDSALIDAVTVTPALPRILDVGRGALARDLEVRDAAGAPLAMTGIVAQPTMIAIAAGGESLGTLHVDGALDDAARSLAERVAAYVSLALLLEHARDDAELRLQTEVLGDLLARPDAPHPHAARWLRRWGIPAGAALRVVVVDAPAEGRSERVHALRALGAGAVLLADHEDHLCFATPDADWGERADALFRAHGWSLRAGVGGPVNDVRLLADAHSRALLAHGSLATLGRDGVVDAAELGMLAALLDLSRRGELPASLTDPVRPLRDYDSARGTALTRTAFLFLECDGHVARVAELAHVHRNTVRQRLERIGSLLGPGWDASPRRLETHLALRVVMAGAT
ncbi:GAF domain-containing protein [Microbacterium sp. ZXX196]|uniref:helix-turn-helix domain-containing protein n=1 Tax=Microbacterium sp. ZXX196 TaxID=2609291 RepID=UPI0018ACDBA5|nr:GAF domain-containing protein [Microbacterium sp. ZXX196]